MWQVNHVCDPSFFLLLWLKEILKVAETHFHYIERVVNYSNHSYKPKVIFIYLVSAPSNDYPHPMHYK